MAQLLRNNGDPSWRTLYPFDSHTLALDRVAYHYLDEQPAGATRDTQGATPTLLFVHGNPTWSFHWRHLILANRDRFRCVAVDHVGCGLSDLQLRPLRLADHIDNLVQLVETLDLQHVTLVAQDWGGAIGLGALLQCQERFDRIALFNTGAFPPWFIPWRIRVCRWPVVGRLALQAGNAFSRAALRMTLSRRQRLDPLVEQAYLAPHYDWQSRAAVYQFVKDIPLSDSHPTWQTLAEIEEGLPRLSELPQLLVWGMRDWCFTSDCLEKFCELWPEAEVQRLADVGHWVVEDASEESQELLSKWLERTMHVPGAMP